METIDRILILFEGQNLEQQQFCKKIGIAPATFSSLKNRKSTVKDKQLFGIKKAYPKISLDWLIMGEGDMWIDNSPSTEIVEEPSAPYGKTNQQLQAELNECKAQLQITTDIISKGLANQNHDTQKKE